MISLPPRPQPKASRLSREVYLLPPNYNFGIVCRLLGCCGASALYLLDFWLQDMDLRTSLTRGRDLDDFVNYIHDDSGTSRDSKSPGQASSSLIFCEGHSL